MNRRQFLRSTPVACASAAGIVSSGFRLLAQDTAVALGAEETKSTSLDRNAPQIRVLMHEADGLPLDAERANTLIVRDLANDPMPQPISRAEGRARIGLAAEPMQLALRLKVPGFGEVYCYADNSGQGYSTFGQFEFVVEAARTRLHRVQSAFERARELGVILPAETTRHLETSRQLVISKSGAEQITSAYKVLAHALHAGEGITLAIARWRIGRLGAPRKEFLFGCLGSGWQRGGDYEKRFVEAFNLATISWYSWAPKPEPVESRINYDRMEGSVQWCEKHGIQPRGFGYAYMANGATPEWLRSWSYEKILPEYTRIVEQTARRYDGRVPVMEIINEAHDKANLFRLSHAQILELTKSTCAAARRGAPNVRRLINHCCLWAEYARRSNEDGTRRWSPFRFIKDCLANGVEFEVLGLQLYYPQHDLLEINRMLDRFSLFKRPIHITELACNSSDGLDAASMRPKSLVPGWHGPWTESQQADWAEAIYTLCYSKPEFEAVGWWDLADVGGHFWPFGGLLHKDFQPKESYRRLLELQRTWGVAKVQKS